jgi:hypothetical protein
MYVDESGDCGILNSPTRFFVLTGLIVHELRWQSYLAEIIKFRQQLKQKFGLRLRDEFHAAALINHPGELVRIKRNDRLAMIREYADIFATLKDVNLINVVVDKQGKPTDYEIFTSAWKSLIQRFENTISSHNFRGPANPDERGLIFCDHTDKKKLMMLLRQMRHYNPVPHRTSYGIGYRNLPLQYIIEDPSFRDSQHSYFVQSVDLAAFLLYQHLAPSAYLKKRAGQNYFNRIKPVLCLQASSSDPDGIVRL